MIKLGENFEIDLDKLISTRMLIQANSGGGKSYAIRKLLEESHGQVQQIVIDLEGEFASLREKYDYLLVGQDGEIPARIQTAELLARKLLKLNVSTIIDLSELKHHERILFVKRFIDSLVNSPKALWHPCMVIVDEAHQFCPEKAKSESASAIIDLCTRGRKRGFCAVLATQRISKLSKDAAAECNNNLVGRTMLDIDQKRAAETLGITNKDQIRNLRNLGDGEFHIFGPAIGKDVKLIQVARTKTIHMDSKNVISSPTPTPKNIAKIMKDVIDLPKEAEDELKTTNDYKTKVIELKREVNRLENEKQKPLIKVDEKALERAELQGTKRAEAHYLSELKESNNSLKQLKIAYERLRKGLQQITVNCSKLLQIEMPDVSTPMSTSMSTPSRISSIPKGPPMVLKKVTLSHPQSPSVTKVSDRYNHNQGISMDIQSDLGLCPRKIYSVLVANPSREFTKVQLGLLSGYSAKSGGFNNAISALNSRRLIERNNGIIKLGETDIDLVVPGFNEISRESWSKNLALCPRTIFEYLLTNETMEFTKDELGEATNYSSGSGGFNNAVSKLNSLGLIQRNNGSIRISSEILEL